MNLACKEKLRAFHTETTDIYGENFARIFREAGAAMGIRGGENGKPDGDKSLDTFSDDILKIEITGPNQFSLTVIDVPGIFRTATPGLTTENDMALVRAMVERAIKDNRTIILAVVPCNVDIATQEILKLATDADPTGLRTMGVLTKPDLATERATQQVIIDLVLGKRNDLKLGYCVVKNRSADDDLSSLQDRDDAEKVFFKSEPWCQLESSGRIGIDALRQRLSGLIQSITRREFPRVRDDIRKKLHATEEKLRALGDSRADTMSQRSYLAEVARKFQDIVGDALDAKYTRKESADEGATLAAKDGADESEGEDKSPAEKGEPGSSPFPELNDILLNHDYVCAKPQHNIMDCIKEVYRSSRGPELGTAMDHAKFLLDVERNGKPVTLNNYFSDRLDHARGDRYQDVHDILQSYYNVSRKRIVDVVCQYVVYHFLLDSEGSPLRLFDTKLVLGLSEEKLNAIAGEDATVIVERERLGQEVKSLKAAINILRS
ncbi:hypothetical protein VTK56DRAFT_5929 [Thermocarpiscus australiensis]